MAISATSQHDDRRDDTPTMPSLFPATPNGSQQRKSMSGRTLRDHYLLANPDSLHDSVEPVQLQSPEASPSLRSSSPSLTVTDTSSLENAGTVDPVDGQLHSQSFEHAVYGPEDPDLMGMVASPKPISKSLPPHELHDIPEERPRRSRKPSDSKLTAEVEVQNVPKENTGRPRIPSFSKSPIDERILKLSPLEIQELTDAPESLPLPASTRLTISDPDGRPILFSKDSEEAKLVWSIENDRERALSSIRSRPIVRDRGFSSPAVSRLEPSSNERSSIQSPRLSESISPRNFKSSSDTARRRESDSRPEPLDFSRSRRSSSSKSQSRSIAIPSSDLLPSSRPQDLPLPPMSIPTYLQLELASSRPSPLYIDRSSASEYPYESSRIKFERLLNFLLLPPQLEQVLFFGALACLDAWLHTFTILPLRFISAIIILMQWWAMVWYREAQFISGFIYHGSGRFWHRQRGRRESVDSAPPSRSTSQASQPSTSTTSAYQLPRHPEYESTSNGNIERLRAEPEREPKRRSTWGRKHHRRTKSQPSALSTYHKADLLQGFVIIGSCILLVMLDASRMYHSIKNQSAVKLYMLWNVLEVADRLLSALGQDIFECLFADETIARGPDGRSRVLRPLGMFVLALVYNTVHAATLFYQVITLHVAVNSYSNALLSLLMSNMFVEIKSTVFKKFEKDNIFQLTCADVVERFQLWLMLLIIGLRNIVEIGSLNVTTSGSTTVEALRNATTQVRNNTILPASFTIMPNWTGEVLSPFLLVLGSEMIVDWLKHAYISKFNNVQPAVYQKYLDVLAKDYYTNAFVNQNLTKRLGLPVIPLSSLFIRASIQTYHMFLATHVQSPMPSTATELALESGSPSPETTAALRHFDNVIRSALGRSTFGTGADAVPKSWFMIGTDDIIAVLTMVIFFLCAFLVLLACKLVLGMVLLSYARNRYSSMKEREHMSLDTKGKRVGGWGMVEVDEDKRRWIYEDDPEGAKALKERERKINAKAREGDKGSGVDFARVTRYEMVAKRIW